MDKKELLSNLLSVDIFKKDVFRDEISGIDFELDVNFNLNNMVKDFKNSERDIPKYKRFVVDGEQHLMENETIEMCYRCYQHVVNPKLEMEDWLLLSLTRGDLIMSLSGRIAELTIGQLEKNEVKD